MVVCENCVSHDHPAAAGGDGTTVPGVNVARGSGTLSGTAVAGLGNDPV